MTMPAWEPPPETVAFYRKMFAATHAAAAENPNSPSMVAVEALLNYGFDIAISAGALSIEFTNSLRDIADRLDQRRASEPPQPPLPTLREVLASARPKFVN